MVRRTDTMETLTFALEVLQRIPVRGSITSVDLQSQLQAKGIVRDLRSVQRMMESLCERFPQIHCNDRGKPYGYSWAKGAQGLSIPHLTLEQSMVLQLAENYLKNLLPQKTMQSMASFFDQARRNLADQASSPLERQWAQKVRVVATSQPLLPPQIAEGVLEAVSEALYHNQFLYVDYRNAKGKKVSAAKVMPLGLAQQGPRLYLVCRFEGYDNERSLALHRISKAEASGLGFERPRNFDLQAYDADGRFGFGEGQRVRLRFTITAEAGQHLLESPLAHDQQATELEDGRLHISATVVDTAMLQWWLRGFGDAVSEVQREVVSEVLAEALGEG